ncbi:hypothetical protein A5742_15280 [Mycolicibacterium fortuitum]|uniref:Integral membrane protein n=1 Tax=Mycolicibacterium fortuitum TaxID=1766 RepID=A0ABD6QBX1_MYCFO|nr:hypothetical protein [Mycolicibacterium fortuitum]OMC32720.1 hypothetical protein A5742_15280 [Mycolicibacterium fortuitum]
MYAESEQAGRGAAMTTVVLSFICAGFGYFALTVIVGTGVLVGLFGPADVDRSEFRIPLLGYTAVATALAVAFTVGAMKLLRHNPSGRTIVIVSSALYAAVAVVEFFVEGPQDVVSNVLSAVPVLTLIFALRPGTKQWCKPQSF